MSKQFKSIANEFFETNTSDYDGRPLSPTAEESKEFFDTLADVIKYNPSEQYLSELICEKNIISLISKYSSKSKLFLLTGQRVYLKKSSGNEIVTKNFIAAGVAKTKEELLDFISSENYIKRITEVYYAIPIATQTSRLMFYKESIAFEQGKGPVDISMVGAELDL